MQILKSINSLHPCKFISMLVFLMTISIYTNRVVASDEYEEIIQDLPAKKDFGHYLIALEKVVDFCIKYKHYVDVNLKLGLIMIDVNLRHVLQQKGTGIPAKVRSRLEKLFVKNDELSNYFQSMVEKHKHDSTIEQNIKLVQLMYNAATWPRPPDKFNKALLNKTNFYSLKQMENIYGNWQNYQKNVNNFDEIIPEPSKSDECIGLLALNAPAPLQLSEFSHTDCLTPAHCKQVLIGGNQFGYGLSHRILFMVIARFSRKCIVFSRKEDKSQTDMYCEKCFNEAKYIALNDFQLPDLMYEQIALCGLLGHAQFLRNHWLKSPLRFQTTEGCFSEELVTGLFDEFLMRDEGNVEWVVLRLLPIMNGQCHGHFTSMAAGALSNALRYIIETN